MLGAAGYAYFRTQAQQQAATLTRLAAMDTSLAIRNQQRAHTANQLIFDLSEVVSRNRNQASAVAVLRQAQEIQARTTALLDTLHQLRHAWQAADPPRPLRRLPAQLARYTRFISRFTAADTPLPAPFAAPETPTWLTTSAPKSAALAFLTGLETAVRQLEATALTNQALKVVFEGTYDRIGALAGPATTTVAPGAVYRAQLLLALAGSTRHVRFSADGRALPLAPATGQGLMQFQVPAARPGQPDTLRAEWHGQVQLPGVTGDTVLRLAVPYFIVKPGVR